jgi:1-deoxy-D-xylulose-5-phosphate reductoisomerase
MPAVLNAANEVCVAGFLGGNLRFLQIVDTVADVLSAAHDAGLPAPRDVEDVLAADAWARERAAATLGRLARR